MISLIKGGAPNKIAEMPNKTEADIQREVANAVESYGFEARLEVSVRGHDPRKKYMRIDVVGFSDGSPVVAFEVKTPKTLRPNSANFGHYNSQQMLLTHLTNNGLPSKFVSSAKEAADFIERFVVCGEP